MMLLLLSLHIAAMVFWCGSQLVLPLLIKDLHLARDHMLQRAAGQQETVGMPRLLFTRLTAPAALVATLSGTAVFLLNGTLEAWLHLKLVLVSLLVVALLLTAWLVLGAAQMTARRLAVCCNVLALVSGLLMLAIVGVVLTKPFADLLP